MGAGASEYLRHIAIARLYLHNIPHIQASWPTMGLDVAQMALLAGADDIGSTMMEENVVSASGTDKTQSTENELQKAVPDLNLGNEIQGMNFSKPQSSMILSCLAKFRFNNFLKKRASRPKPVPARFQSR